MRRSASVYSGSALRFWRDGRLRDLSYAGLGSISLDELRRRGRSVDAAELDRIAASTGPRDAATVVYTSGTTVTSGGKSITPANIEAALRGIRWVSEALVFGDDRPYLVAELTLNRDWIRSLAAWPGVKPDIEVMATDPRVHDHLAHEVERVNQRFARVEQIKRFAILDRDLTQETGELTPTQKARRAVVYARFKDVIDALYQ